MPAGDVSPYEHHFVEQLAAGAKGLHVLSLAPTQEPEVGFKEGLSLFLTSLTLLLPDTWFARLSSQIDAVMTEPATSNICSRRGAVAIVVPFSAFVFVY